MRLPKSVLGVLAAGALLLGGAVPAVAEDAVPGDGPTTSVSAPADEAGGAESGAVGADRSGSGEGGKAASTDSAASDTAQAPALRRAARAASLDGDYKFGARWANPVNASTTGYSYEDEAHTILSFDKMFNKLHTAMVDVDFNLTDTGNIKSLPVGAVKVTLPRSSRPGRETQARTGQGLTRILLSRTRWSPKCPRLQIPRTPPLSTGLVTRRMSTVRSQ